MDGRTDPLNDAALEQQVEALLSVEPSPDFVARARARVAEESMSGGWRWQWPIAAAVTATAIVVAFAMRPPTETASSLIAPVREASVTRQAPPAPPVAVRAPEDSARVPPRRDADRGARQRVATPVARLPEVVIPENEKRGFELFLEELRDEKNAAVIAEAASGRTTPGPPWLDIQPMTIEPLHEVSVHQGEGQ